MRCWLGRVQRFLLRTRAKRKYIVRIGLYPIAYVVSFAGQYERSVPVVCKFHYSIIQLRFMEKLM